MRFVCDSCRAQYMISDEKVGAKGVKVRCKKCGHVIIVRPAHSSATPVVHDESPTVQMSEMTRAEASAPPQSDLEGTSTGEDQPIGENVLSGVDEDEIGAVFDQVLNFGANPTTESLPNGTAAASGGMAADSATANGIPPEAAGEGLSGDDAFRTQVLDQDQVQRLAAETARTYGAEYNLNGSSGAPHQDWFIAIDDRQVGPLALDEVKRYWEASEIGPESLCWRAGFADWLPLRDVDELVSVLAPQPKKVANEVAPAPAFTVPVETSYNAGGVSRTIRSEVPVAAAAAPAAEEIAWKPSAASALASLVKEEIEALTKPAAPKAEVAKPEEKKVRGILDIASEQVPRPASLDTPKTAQQPAPAPSPAVAEPIAAPPSAQAPVAIPAADAPIAAAPAPYPAPQYPAPQHQSPHYPAPQYPAPQYPAPQYQAPQYQAVRPPAPRSGRAALLGAVATVVLALAGFGAYQVFVQRQPAGVIAGTATPGSPPPAPVTPPAAQAAPASPSTSNGVASGSTAPAAAAPTAEPSAAAPPPSEPRPIAAAPKVPLPKIDPAPRGGSTRGSSASSRRGESKGSGSTNTPSRSSGGSAEDEFDAVFGSTEKRREEPKKDNRSPKQRDVYIPPAPGSADIPERLGSSDIMSVVLANKPSIKKCVDTQKSKDPGLGGKLVVRWTIKTNGRASNVSVVTDEFRSTYLASCITGLVKGWKFPAHRVQGEPVDFPFTF